jgi:general stress protein 26
VTDKTNGQGFHPRLAELPSGDNFAVLTTLMPDGHPQIQVMWVDADDYLLISTELHRQKFRNVDRDPRVTLTIWGKEDPITSSRCAGKVCRRRRGRRREIT